MFHILLEIGIFKRIVRTHHQTGEAHHSQQELDQIPAHTYRGSGFFAMGGNAFSQHFTPGESTEYSKDKCDNIFTRIELEEAASPEIAV